MPAITLPQFKALVREQYFMLLIDEEGALAAIPGLLPQDAQERRKAFAFLREVLSAQGEIAGAVAERLKRVAALFGLEGEAAEAASTASPPVYEVAELKSA
jgi:hypothetical protein